MELIFKELAASEAYSQLNSQILFLNKNID